MRFLVIGTGKTAISVAKAVARTEGAELVGMIGDARREAVQSSFAKAAAKLDVPSLSAKTLKSSEALDFIRDKAPDYVVSANNFLIFGKEALALPKLGTVNFHNGLLPRYAGVNPFCWALMRGETEYGMTWHLVDEGIDTGPLLLQERFDIDDDMPAVHVMIRCIELAISTFRDTLLPNLIAGDVRPYRREDVEHEYFTARDRPHDGYLPWWLEGKALRNYVRALSFAPLPNMFYRPRVETEPEQAIYAADISSGPRRQSAVAGQVVACDDDSVTVATPDATLILREFYDKPYPNRGTILSTHPLKVGDQLERP